MCGIVGMIDASATGFFATDRNIFFGMLLLNSFRGAHSTGTVGVLKSGDADIFKVLSHPYELARWKAQEEFYTRMDRRYWGVIGHGRLATQGEIKIQNAHPFYHKGITLVHNGTLSNFADLQKDLNTSFEVDSELVCYMVAEFGLEETLKQIRGAYTLVFNDAEDGTINMVRNHERPLEIGKYHMDDRLIFASEKHVLKWASEKGTSLKEIHSLPTLEWRKYYRENNRLKLDKVDIKPWPVKSYHHPNHYPSHSNAWLGEHMYEDDILTERIGYSGGFKSPMLIINGKEYKADDTIHFNMVDAIEGYDSEGKGFCSIKGVCTSDKKVHVAAHFKGTQADVLALFSEDNKECRLTGKISSFVPLPNEPNIDFRVFVSDVKEYPPTKAEVAAPAEESKSSFVSKVSLPPTRTNNEKSSSSVSEVSNVVDISSKSNARAVIKLLDGTFTSEKRFKALAALGCKLCDSHPKLEEADKTIISSNPETKDIEMFCPTCVQQHSYDLNALRMVQ